MSFTNTIFSTRLWIGAALLVSCGTPGVQRETSSIKTINGKPDLDGLRYPSMFKMFKTIGGSRKFACSAIAIGGPYLLTAAHCLRDEDGTGAKAGVVTMESVKGNSYKVLGYVADYYGFKEVDMHLELAKGQDIAVIRVDRDIKEDSAKVISPDDFPHLPTYLATLDQTALIESAGFGFNNFVPAGGKTGTLNYVDVGYRGPVSEEMEFHLGTTEKSVCKGDSGGGTFLRVGHETHLIGIVSRDHNPWENTESCGGPTNGHIVTNLAHPTSQKFIRDALDELDDLIVDPDGGTEGPETTGIFPVPGLVESEDYTSAGDFTDGNVGNKKDYSPKWRNGNDWSVDLYSIDKGIVVGYTEKGEHLYYRIEVKEKKKMKLQFIASREAPSSQPKGAVHITLGNVASGVTVKDFRFDKVKKSNWSDYNTYDVGTLELDPGIYRIDLEIVESVNLDKLIFLAQP